MRELQVEIYCSARRKYSEVVERLTSIIRGSYSIFYNISVVFIETPSNDYPKLREEQKEMTYIYIYITNEYFDIKLRKESLIYDNVEKPKYYTRISNIDSKRKMYDIINGVDKMTDQVYLDLFIGDDELTVIECIDAVIKEPEQPDVKDYKLSVGI